MDEAECTDDVDGHHGEVGNTLEEDRQLVQHEIELRPVPLEQAADHLVVAKWVVREVAAAHGLEATFAPSVSSEGAGNGLHTAVRSGKAPTPSSTATG